MSVSLTPAALIPDVVILAVMVLTVVLGAKAGLLKSLAGVIVVVCSAVGASFAAKLFADPVAEKLAPLLTSRLTEKLESGGSATRTASAGEMLQQFGFSGKPLDSLVDQVTEQVRETGRSVVETVVGTVTHSIAYAAVFLVSFLILLLVLTLLVKGLELAAELPGLKTVNGFGGAVLGLIKGVLLVFAAVWVLRKLQLIITPELVENTVLLKFFANNSPLSLLTGL